MPLPKQRPYSRTSQILLNWRVYGTRALHQCCLINTTIILISCPVATPETQRGSRTGDSPSPSLWRCVIWFSPCPHLRRTSVRGWVTRPSWWDTQGSVCVCVWAAVGATGLPWLTSLPELRPWLHGTSAWTIQGFMEGVRVTLTSAWSNQLFVRLD